MSSPSAASFDPVFWFFHSNWDRLWWQWQVKVEGTDLNGLLTTIDRTTDNDSYQIFTVPALQTVMMTPFSAAPLNLDTVKVIDSVNSYQV
jgi:tyrosinase